MPHTEILPSAAIFDMDGVLVDSNPFHVEKIILGHRNDTAFRHFFGPRLDEKQAERLGEELEERFRRVFQPHARPLPGLEGLVVECHKAGIPMAVASSATTKNVEFIVEALGFGPYFRHLVTGDEVRHPKPDPEIYLKAAEKLAIEPWRCVAFEDSHVGIESAKRAGMKCVAIASTFPLDELREQTHADLAVQGFEKLDLRMLRGLFSPDKAGGRTNP
ncbi:MAG: HAD family hydrolase [Acidobacteria bacterium]|nr:HAD family hydrolase [Acidobacteriota bacterium]